MDAIVEYIKPFLENGLKIFRLMPFVVVSYVLISAIFAGNFKMFILFVGLLFSALLVVALSRTIYTTIYGTDTVIDVIDKIKSFSIFNFGVVPLSFLPLSLNIYAFLLSYYLYVSSANKDTTEDDWNRNWPIVMMLSILLVLDMVYFKYIFKENASYAIGIPTILGLGIGVIWPVLVGKSNWAVSVADTNSKCSPTETTYQCTLASDGSLIS